ncbi:MAG: hypothetical protein IPM11_00280 [Micropruina sp.]|nr:hypothetical protein [Micropruina sp.]
MSAEPATPTVDVLTDAYERNLRALKECAIVDGPTTGWGTWETDAVGNPTVLRADRMSLYDGNAGIAWAMSRLGEAVVPAGALPTQGGLLGGPVGLGFAAGSLGRVSLEGRGFDLGDGLAGDLLALVRTHSPDEDAVRGIVARLDAAARWDAGGACWPDPREASIARPLCGLAHGASGIALALAEAALAYPSVAEPATRLVAGALRWEAAWFNPVAGGWPDLRDSEAGGHPVMWCHGAAGIAAVRLRLLQAVRAGLVLDYPVEAIAAEAHAGVLACGKSLTGAVRTAREYGFESVPGGLTLCHGMGGPLDVLVLAAEVWELPQHLDAARRIASDLITLAPDDPMEWPSGLRKGDALGLFVGTAGTALLLARLIDPVTVRCLSLLDTQR